jgi:hypothetical protein
MIDNHWFSAALRWALDHGGDLPAIDEARAMVKAEATPYADKGKATLALARSDWESGNDDLRYRAKWELANACQSFGRVDMRDGSTETAGQWLAIAHFIYVGMGERFADSARNCERLIADAGMPSVPDIPFAVPEAESEGLAADTSRGIDGGREPATQPSEVSEDTVAAVSASEAALGGARDDELATLVRSWAGSGDVCQYLLQLRDSMERAFCKKLTVAVHLKPLFEADFPFLGELLVDAGLPDAITLHERASQARKLAATSNLVFVREEHLRRRWLAAALWNYALWKDPNGWPTNEPECCIDFLGYLSAITMSRRYHDSAKNLLIASAEVMVQIAKDFPSLMSYPFVCRWLQCSIGQSLLFGGPKPVEPTASRWDQRLQHHDREGWGALLLDEWRQKPELRLSVAFTLANMGAWELGVVGWILGLVYRGIPTPGERISYWEGAVLELLDMTGPIYIPTNPWSVVAIDQALGGVSSVSTDVISIRQIPDFGLKAMTAQLVDRDLTPVVTVQGTLFSGRRVPTYLLIGRFGPFAVLKVDYEDRVEREHRHFHEYARRLHQTHRPSDCQIGDLTLSVSDNKQPLKAIFTSYVFSRDERPMTLSQWLRQSPVDAVPAFMESFFLQTLAPWLAHVRRDTIDLRLEYPVLRPRELVANAKLNAPQAWAQIELSRLDAQELEATLGARVNHRTSSFEEIWAPIAHGLFRGSQHGTLGEGLINPAWVAAELAELGGTSLQPAIHTAANPLSAFDTLTAICHGDMHADNILCASSESSTGFPRPIVIDFEAAHQGHVCKDFARLEASILCQVFQWDSNDVLTLHNWMNSSSRSVYSPPDPDAALSSDLQRAIAGAKRLRELAFGCGQAHWPLTEAEYYIALLASLLPIARYQVAAPPVSRATALLLAAVVATELLKRWQAKELSQGNS